MHEKGLKTIWLSVITGVIALENNIAVRIETDKAELHYEILFYGGVIWDPLMQKIQSHLKEKFHRKWLKMNVNMDILKRELLELALDIPNNLSLYFKLHSTVYTRVFFSLHKDPPHCAIHNTLP
ncbi:hypothetical protein ACJX0J_017038 [Zea mays]